jgi:exonuclease SbcD
MKLVHLADLHLGFRQFQRTARNGVNLREADVARAFQDAIDQIITLAPEIVVVAGDLFHASRPPNNAIVHAHDQFLRLRESLPETVVVMVSGNHDAPRSADVGNILALFKRIGIHVAASGAKRISVPERELSILAVPDVAGVRPLIAPDPDARYNVLVLHGEVEYAEADDAHPWDYVALGHYHVHREVAPRCFYAGSIDYTSTNVWGELAEEAACGVPGKGFIVADLATGAHEFHPLKAQRAFVDLPAIDGADKTPAEIDAAIRCAVESCAGGIEGKVVRLVVRDITRSTAKGLDHRAMRSYKARAHNFQLVTHKPAAIVDTTVGAPAPRRRLKSLGEIVRDTFAKRAIPSDLDRSALEQLALKYLGEAEAKEDVSVLAENREEVAV